MSLFYQNELVTLEAAAAIPAGAVVVLDGTGKAALAAADATADAVVGVAHVGTAAAGEAVTVALPGVAKIVGVLPAAGQEPLFGDRLCVAANGTVTCLPVGSEPEANAVCIGRVTGPIQPEGLIAARLVEPYTIVAANA